MRSTQTSFLLALTGAMGLCACAQTAAPPTSVHGSGTSTVLFSRNSKSGQRPSTPASTAESAAPKAASAAAVAITDAERSALTVLRYDCDVHLTPATHALSVDARLTVRNDSLQPLQRIALQISSTLNWDFLHANGVNLTLAVHAIDSDLDHTGKVNEAVAVLPHPLAPGATLALDALYSGTVEQSAARLVRLGAPDDVALASEWDRIEPGFTGLRGIGNVVWFPVSVPPALLGEGTRLFNEIGQWKLREQAASLRLHVVVEYKDDAPNMAVLNGMVTLPDADATADATPLPANVLRIASFTLAQEHIGFHALGLFVLTRQKSAADGIDVYAREGDEDLTANYAKAAAMVRPLAEQWFGAHPLRPIVVVDLPEQDDLPSEDRNILFTPLRQADAQDLTPVLAHMASHAYFASPRVWMDEGIAQFFTTLWTEHVAGRAAAIQQLNSQRGALALAEPAQPGKDAGQSLIEAYSDIYYRDKAAFVFWMLRDLLGDGALGQALQTYHPAQDRQPGYFQHIVQSVHAKDIEWFFDDWIYRDRGLPDLSIAGVYTRTLLLHGGVKSYLTSVDVQNEGTCAAQVPVTVQGDAAEESSSILVAAHSKASVRIVLQNPAHTVTVNDGTVPEIGTGMHQAHITTPPAQ
jgi:hypothetical protein